MSRRLLLEGSDLEAIVTQMRREHGPEARVVRAERVREGGIGGFFAKEHYEVLVDVPDAPTRAAGGVPSAVPGVMPGAGRAASSIEDLLEAADAGDLVGGSAGADAPPSLPGLSTTGDAFAEVLDHVRALVAQTGVAVTAGQGAASLVAVPDAPDAAAGTTGAAAGARGFVPAASGPFAAAARTATFAPAPVSPPTADGAAAGSAARDDGSGDGAPGADGSPLGAVTEPRVVRRPVVTPRAGVTVPELLDVGVPADVVAAVLGTVAPPPGVRVALSSVLEHVERAPRVHAGAGTVLVVVGEPGTVREAAAQLAARAGVAPSRVVAAGDHGPVLGPDEQGPTVEDADDARDLQHRARAARMSVVVAVAVPAHRAGRERATELVAALGPDQLWAAVDVGRSRVETRRWLEAVQERRPVDALAVCGVAESSAPAQVLALGIPVGMLDGLVASAPVWAATLAERLDDAVWD